MTLLQQGILKKGFRLPAADMIPEQITAAALQTGYMIPWKHRWDGKMVILAWEADGSHCYMAERKHPENIEVPGENTSNEWLEAIADEDYDALG